MCIVLYVYFGMHLGLRKVQNLSGLGNDDPGTINLSLCTMHSSLKIYVVCWGRGGEGH